MRPVSVFPDYLVKLVIPASRDILKPAVICRCVSLLKMIKKSETETEFLYHQYFFLFPPQFSRRAKFGRVEGEEYVRRNTDCMFGWTWRS